MRKIYVFRKWDSLSDSEKLIKLKQGALWTDINVFFNGIMIVIIFLILLGVIR